MTLRKRWQGLSHDRQFTVKATTIIVITDLLFNALGLWGYNQMRESGMARAAAERQIVSDKLDAAWHQRERLAAETERACRAR